MRAAKILQHSIRNLRLFIAYPPCNSSHNLDRYEIVANPHWFSSMISSLVFLLSDCIRSNTSDSDRLVVLPCQCEGRRNI